MVVALFVFLFFSSRSRHTISYGDWSSDVCSSDLRVRDPLWIGLGTFGLLLLGAQLVGTGSAWTVWSLVGSAAILFYAVFLGKPLFDDAGFHVRPVRILLFLAAAVLFFASLSAGSSPSAGPPVAELASMPVMLVVYQLFYRV